MFIGQYYNANLRFVNEFFNLKFAGFNNKKVYYLARTEKTGGFHLFGEISKNWRISLLMPLGLLQLPMLRL
jgi:hypothetical protein